MRRHLPYTVECQHPPCMAYEAIAAFNVESVAIEYARQCFLANGRHGMSYRVTVRGNVIGKYDAPRDVSAAS